MVTHRLVWRKSGGTDRHRSGERCRLLYQATVKRYTEQGVGVVVVAVAVTKEERTPATYRCFAGLPNEVSCN